MKLAALSSIAFCSWLASGPLYAQALFDNTTNSVCCGYAVGLYPGSSNTFVDAYSFTVPSHNYQLDAVGLLSSINAAIGPAPNGLTLFLYADSNGSPGAVLETWDGVPVPGSITLVTTPSVAHPLLQAGLRYWFGVTTTNPAETAIWWINPALVQGTGCGSINGGDFSCSTLGVGAFQIVGQVVPPAVAIQRRLEPLIRGLQVDRRN
jgi:hypothetical protein